MRGMAGGFMGKKKGLEGGCALLRSFRGLDLRVLAVCFGCEGFGHV